MHASELVELAAAVSAQGASLIHGQFQPPASAIERYWRGSKSRLDRWSRTIRQFTRHDHKASAKWRKTHWPVMRAVCEEILTGEILTRVFAAVMSARDRAQGNYLAEPAARSILIAHLEARHSVLTILLRGSGINAQQAELLNNLRRKSERWSDMLIGYLAEHVAVDEFAVDGRRAADFSEDLRHQNSLENGANAWALVKAAMKTSFGRGLGPLAANGDLNERIAHGVMACFPPDQFDSIGKLQSLWMVRLRGAADDAQYLLDELSVDADGGVGDESRLAGDARLGRLRKYGFC